MSSLMHRGSPAPCTPLLASPPLVSVTFILFSLLWNPSHPVAHVLLRETHFWCWFQHAWPEKLGDHKLLTPRGGRKKHLSLNLPELEGSLEVLSAVEKGVRVTSQPLRGPWNTKHGFSPSFLPFNIF